MSKCLECYQIYLDSISAYFYTQPKLPAVATYPMMYDLYHGLAMTPGFPMFLTDRSHQELSALGVTCELREELRGRMECYMKDAGTC